MENIPDLKIFPLILAENPISPDFPEWKKFSKLSLIGGNPGIFSLFISRTQGTCPYMFLFVDRRGGGVKHLFSAQIDGSWEPVRHLVSYLFLQSNMHQLILSGQLNKPVCYKQNKQHSSKVVEPIIRPQKCIMDSYKVIWSREPWHLSYAKVSTYWVIFTCTLRRKR